jgi:hypothetical protein
MTRAVRLAQRVTARASEKRLGDKNTTLLKALAGLILSYPVCDRLK